jgi:VWFA-related protein
VDVLVTRAGEPVTGLTAADFELRDSGVRQQIRSIAVEHVPLNVLVALDVSDSVEGKPLGMLKTAAAATVELLSSRDQVALLAFNHGIPTWVPWSADLRAVRTRIERIQASGGTGLHDAVFAALALGNRRPGSRNLVLLFTDGEDTTGWLPGKNVIDAARRSETVVYAISVRQTRHAYLGYQVDFRSGLQPAVPHVHPSALADSLVERVAAETGGRYVDVEEIGMVKDAFLHILAEFRTRYLLAYVPTGVPASGWHAIDVRLTRGESAVVRARRGYFRDTVAK